MSIFISKPGILTTVQDLGRTGFRSFGINPNGPMDPISARLVNLLLGNDERAAILEMHFPAAEIFFECDTRIAIGGADLSPQINGRRDIPNWCVHNVDNGDVLKFSKRVSGNRAYVAVAGGLTVDTWLRSSSTNLAAHVGGYHGRRAEAGDRIATRERDDHDGAPAGTCIGPSLVRRDTSSVRLMPGPEFDSLTALSETRLFSEPFSVTRDSDRMGFRLKGPRLDRFDSREMLSSGTTFGTVQLLPNGQLIILMADHQTTGGYPRIANVAYVDLGILGQLAAGDSFRFQFINNAEAERTRMQLEHDLAILRVGVKLRSL
jgi:antagonist of KipI